MHHLEHNQGDDEKYESEQPFVFVDDSSIALFELACKVGRTDVPVLLNGPTGAGKEIVARVIHESSPRASQPFVAVNCAAITASLAEDLLFGHEKGAFTGAHKFSKGYFEQAQGGTLFLDEIGEMPLELQAKLLRVLQEKSIVRVGGSVAIDLDVRIVTATNVNLKRAVSENLFREDLYYRISGFKLTLLPLCQRKKDIEALAYVLIQKHSSKPFPKLNESARSALMAYSWPGNVRELENLIRRALIMCDGKEIKLEDLLFDEDEEGSAENDNSVDSDVFGKQAAQPHSEDNVYPPNAGNDMLMSSLRNELEYKNIMAAMAVTENREKAARKLGISPRTLRYKINKLRNLGMAVPTAYARV